MARKKKKDDEELLDLSIELQSDSEDRFARFAQWQKQYRFWLVIGTVLALVLGMFFFYKQGLKTKTVYQPMESDLVAKLAVSDEKEARFLWTRERIEDILDEKRELTPEVLVDKAGKATGVSADGEGLSLSYYNEASDKVLRTVTVYFVKNSATQEYRFDWLSYYQLTAQEYPQEEEREFSMLQSDYDSLVVKKTTYQEAIALLGVPNQSLVSNESSNYSLPAITLNYIQDKQKQVTLIFTEEGGQVVLTRKVETVWSN